MTSETHLHHLLDVLLDDRRVGVGLHRHGPLVDHAGLGVGRGGGARVQLQPMRDQQQQKDGGHQHREGGGQRKGNTAAVSSRVTTVDQNATGESGDVNSDKHSIKL